MIFALFWNKYQTKKILLNSEIDNFLFGREIDKVRLVKSIILPLFRNDGIRMKEDSRLLTPHIHLASGRNNTKLFILSFQCCKLLVFAVKVPKRQHSRLKYKLLIDLIDLLLYSPFIKLPIRTQSQRILIGGKGSLHEEVKF